LRGNAADIILEGPNGVLLEQSPKFTFKANNQVGYEALITGMLLAQEVSVRNLLGKSDSSLVTGQVSRACQAKDPQLASYLKYVNALAKAFSMFELTHVLREQNVRAYLLFKLASFGKGGTHRSVYQETLKLPRINTQHYSVETKLPEKIFQVSTRDTWMTPHVFLLK